MYKPYFDLPWSYEGDDRKNHSSVDKSQERGTPDLILSDSEDSSCTEDLMHPTELCSIDTTAPCVRFKDVRVREYAVIVGDHPLCSDNLPLTLDWKHAEEKVYDICDYMTMRPKRTGTRGVRIAHRLSYWKRLHILENVGESLDGDKPVDPVDILRDLRESPSLFDNYFGFPADMVQVQVLDD